MKSTVVFIFGLVVFEMALTQFYSQGATFEQVMRIVTKQSRRGINQMNNLRVSLVLWLRVVWPASPLVHFIYTSAFFFTVPCIYGTPLSYQRENMGIVHRGDPVINWYDIIIGSEWTRMQGSIDRGAKIQRRQ